MKSQKGIMSQDTRHKLHVTPKKLLVSLCLCVFVSSGLSFSYAAGESVQTLNLDGLIAEAKANNPELLAAKKRWDAAKERVPQAKAWEDPVIGIKFEKIPRGTLKLNKTMPEDRMLSVQQAFPLLGKLSLKGKIALVEAQVSASEYKAKELELINQIKSVYYELFMNEKEIVLNQENLILMEAIAKVAEAKYSVGDIEQEMVLKIYAEIARIKNDILNLQEEGLSKRVFLNSLLNRDFQGGFDNFHIDENVSFSADIQKLYQKILISQPELLIFSYAVEKNKYLKDLAKKSVFPDIMAGIVQRGITSGTIGPWDLMLSFSAPLWFWAKQRYQIKEAITNIEEAEASYKAMQNKAFAQVRDLTAKIEIAKNKIRLYKTSLIPILESSIESSQAAFQSGKGDFMMFLDSERLLVETKMSYYKALVEYNMNLAELEREVGGN